MTKAFLATVTAAGLVLASFGASTTEGADPLGYQARLGRQTFQPTATVQYGIPHARYNQGSYIPNYGRSYVPNYGQNRHVVPRQYPGHRQGHYDYHDTSHYDYHPGYLQRHGYHFHYVPGHYDFHRQGHYDYHHGRH